MSGLKNYLVRYTILYWRDEMIVPATSEEDALKRFLDTSPGIVNGNGRVLSVTLIK